MSGTMVAANGGPSFAQQGSVDWVALSNSSVQFSVAVLARLSRAGIDAFTLQFGRAICSSFSLEPHAQERIYDAIVKLKKYGSYQDIIWFGFGIKDVVTDLADTEEGLTLVALCAALAATYETMYAAMVVRELCVLCKAPQSFTPAVRQWKALVGLCSGMFADTHFTLVANGFRRLISGHSNHLVERHSPTTPSTLAEAILMLAKVSKGNLLNATFCGGVDCAWLAAFAVWILSLDVTICDSSGSLLYRSRGVPDKPPQVTVIVPNRAENAVREILVKSKASLIPSGQILIQKDPALCGVKLLNWQGPWDTILHEVFHGKIDDLLAGDIGKFSISNHPVNPLIWTQKDSRGQAFIKFAARRLPEIAECLLATTPWDDSTDYVDDLGRDALRSIETLCPCVPHSQNNQKKLREEDIVCLKVMAETIATYLWILLDSDIDEDVLPSITGLANLYTWQSRANKSSASALGEFDAPIVNCDFPVLGIDLVFHVLSGLAIPGIHSKHESLPPNDHLARVGNGICVYYRAIEDLNLPPETMFRLRVVRGYISYSGVLFKEICGFKNVKVDSSLKSYDLRGETPIRSVKTIAQETENETRLEMAYLVHSLNETGQFATHWLHLPLIFRKLQRRSSDLFCAGNCPALYEWKKRKNQTSPYPRRVETWPWGLDKEEYDRTQKMLSDFKHASNTWILLSSPGLFTIITGQPILLYTLISQSSLCLLSFKDCLSCIMRIGGVVGVYDYTFERVRCTTSKFLTLNPYTETIVSWKQSIEEDCSSSSEDSE